MTEIDVADLPIDELERNLAVFAHDYEANPLGIKWVFSMVLLPNEKKYPTLVEKASELIREYCSTLRSVTAKHNETRSQIKTMSREAIRKWVGEYKSDIDKTNSLLERFEAFWERNKKAIDHEFNTRFERIFKKNYEESYGRSVLKSIEMRLQFQKQQFNASRLGLPIISRPDLQETTDLYDFFNKWSKQEFKDRDGISVKVVFRGKPVPRIKTDLGLLQRTIYNIITDAINHTPGRPVYIVLRRKNGRIFISVTNEGKKLTPDEIAKIGKERYSRRLNDPKRGYGKIMVRLGAEAMGGQFHVGNSAIGPLLEISFLEPAQKKVARKPAKVIRMQKKRFKIESPKILRRRAV